MYKETVPTSNNEQTLTYKVVGKRKIDLSFYPPAKVVYENAPVYLIIPGGGWNVCCGKESMVGMSIISVNKLREEGFAIVSIDYRCFRDDSVLLDSIISDCMDAARYISKFARILKIDANRIVTSGHSAGAHLALMLAVAPHNLFENDSEYVEHCFNVIGCAPLSAPTILYPLENGKSTLGFNVDNLFKSKDYDYLLYHQASPYDYVNSETPPMLISAGTHDELVFPEGSILFHQKCYSLGVKSNLIMSQYGGHSFECMVNDRTVMTDLESIELDIVDFSKSLVE